MSYNEMSIRDARVITVTPAMAIEMLKKNHSNRIIRPSVVKSYASDMANGSWKITHQGIAFNSNGDLMDGQHRLSALIMANKNIDMLVCTYNQDIGAINSPIDLHAKRSIADILGRDAYNMSAIIFIVKELSGYTHLRGEHYTSDFLDKLGDKYDWMKDNMSGTNRRLFTSAAIRAACFVAYLSGYDWSKQYNYLATGNIKELDQHTYMLYKKLTPYQASTGTRMFRGLSFNASFAVATKMMNEQKIFTNNLLEKAREKAIKIIKPYFE